MEAPNDLKSALSIAFNVLLHASKETNRTQTFNYFNVVPRTLHKRQRSSENKGKPAPVHTKP